MKNLFLLILTLFVMGNGKAQEYNKLTEEEAYVILKKGTERPFTGKYNHHKEAGYYTFR